MMNTISRTSFAIALAVAGTALAQREERFNRTVEVGEHGELTLSNVSGDIRVEGATGAQIVIDAVKRLDEDADPDLLDSVQIDVTQTGDRVRVETRHTGRYGRHHHEGGVSVSYRVRVPRGTEVELHSVSGDVTLLNVSGEASAESVSGDVSATDVPNLTEAKSVSGDVRVLRARSPRDVEIESVSGEVFVEDIEAEEVNVSSVSGNVTLDGVSCKRAALESVSGEISYTGAIARGGRYDFKSHSGDVVVSIGDDVGFQLEASTFSGEIESEMPLKTTSTDRKRRQLSAVSGDGSAFIEAQTFSGDVLIRKR
jgi:DUF4097 and DUF4098 domain-containing protein YvlB